MAIISIPSSIGGVAIPGGLLAKGPLAALFGNKTGLAILQYPRDLGSATRGHYIQFFINEVKETQLVTTAKNVAGVAQQLLDAPMETIKASAQSIGKESATTENVNTEDGTKTNTEAAIALYMPETMAFTYNTPYDDTSLLEVGSEALSALSSLAGKIPDLKKGGAKTKAAVNGAKNAVGGAAGTGSKLLTSVPKSGAVRLLAKSQGLAINPQKQLLFSGIGFRDYQLVFTFTPYSKAESEQIEKIIKQFKMAAAPAITTSAGGMFFKVPKSFKIKFMFNNKENTKISKVTDSVLTAVDVNYSPNTFVAMDDGAPAQIMLTLNFKEISLVDRTMIDKGGY